MKILYCVSCAKYRIFEKSKTSCVLEKILVLSTISNKCLKEKEKKLKKKNYLRY